MSVLDLDQTCKILLTQNCQIWNIFPIRLLYICIKGFEVIKNVKMLKFEEEWNYLPYRGKKTKVKVSWEKFLFGGNFSHRCLKLVTFPRQNVGLR